VLWVVRIGELLGDDALEVGGDDCPVECAAFADDAVGESNPALGAFGDLEDWPLWFEAHGVTAPYAKKGPASS